ncbi:CAM kinase, SNF1 family, putative [Eimeria necatrix]|uniref:CAM kinase, SNF1 family, putative n=1 Tax=Eimeria necatrix TaxID=51315 RepID=U6MVZ6_9EIME|nr:CAM kinase, SNF1 family, putative [Eimeria necatrix]CDJ68126.1 CAM kinase, SNF1 family, putative [Eimeria necatrix]
MEPILHQLQQIQQVQQLQQLHQLKGKTELPLVTGATRLVSIEVDPPPGVDLHSRSNRTRDINTKYGLDSRRGIGYQRGVDPKSGAHARGPEDPPGPPYLCCWVNGESNTPLFVIPLKGSRVVNNITELGPCLYIISSAGEFEFQCPSRPVCSRWLEILKSLGVSILKFTDLYRLVEFIGEGSFAKVYVGQHLFTGENVVVKAVDKKKVLESNVYTEIEVLRKVTHPYIMRLYAAYEQEDFVCLVLEYLRGGELFEYLSVNGPFSEDQARFAIRRVLLALQEIHSKGVVHRDLKTENLIIENPANPASIKLIDFGLAATVGSPAMKMRCGSPGYVAPEILQDLPYGPKVDVFSSGVILFTLLAGFPPFRGQNVKEILKRNLRCQLAFTHPTWSRISHSAKDLIGWMCSRQQARRCAAVQALTHPWFYRIPRPIGGAAETGAKPPVPAAAAATAEPKIDARKSPSTGPGAPKATAAVATVAVGGGASRPLATASTPKNMQQKLQAQHQPQRHLYHDHHYQQELQQHHLEKLHQEHEQQLSTSFGEQQSNCSGRLKQPGQGPRGMPPESVILEQHKDTSFFNSAPPGGPHRSDGEKGRDNSIILEGKDSQDDAHVRSLRRKQAVSKKSSGAAKTATGASPRDERPEAVTAAAVADRFRSMECEEKDGGRLFTSKASAVDPPPAADAAVAAAAATAVTAAATAGVLAAAARLSLQQQQQQKQEQEQEQQHIAISSCSSAVPPIPSFQLSLAAVRASRAPAADVICELIPTGGNSSNSKGLLTPCSSTFLEWRGLPADVLETPAYLCCEKSAIAAATRPAAATANAAAIAAAGVEGQNPTAEEDIRTRSPTSSDSTFASPTAAAFGRLCLSPISPYSNADPREKPQNSYVQDNSKCLSGSSDYSGDTPCGDAQNLAPTSPSYQRAYQVPLEGFADAPTKQQLNDPFAHSCVFSAEPKGEESTKTLEGQNVAERFAPDTAISKTSVDPKKLGDRDSGRVDYADAGRNLVGTLADPQKASDEFHGSRSCQAGKPAAMNGCCSAHPQDNQQQHQPQINQQLQLMVKKTFVTVSNAGDGLLDRPMGVEPHESRPTAELCKPCCTEDNCGSCQWGSSNTNGSHFTPVKNDIWEKESSRRSSEDSGCRSPCRSPSADDMEHHNTRKRCPQTEASQFCADQQCLPEGQNFGWTKGANASAGDSQCRGSPSSSEGSRTLRMQVSRKIRAHRYLVPGPQSLVRNTTRALKKSTEGMIRPLAPPCIYEEDGPPQEPSNTARDLEAAKAQLPRGLGGGSVSKTNERDDYYRDFKELHCASRKGSVQSPTDFHRRGSTRRHPVGDLGAARIADGATGSDNTYERSLQVRSTSNTSTSTSSSSSSGIRSSRSCSNNSSGKSRSVLPLLSVQFRLSEIMALPFLNKVASALGARDWLRAKVQSSPRNPPEQL